MGWNPETTSHEMRSMQIQAALENHQAARGPVAALDRSVVISSPGMPEVRGARISASADAVAEGGPARLLNEVEYQTLRWERVAAVLDSLPLAEIETRLGIIQTGDLDG
jgi:hypothetical protein